MRKKARIPPFLGETLTGSHLEALDAGAAGGVSSHWRPFLPLMSVIAFEPDERECARQQRRALPGITWVPLALAGRTEQRDLHVLARPTGSSLLPPNVEVLGRYSAPDYFRVSKVVPIRCSSLADFLRDEARVTPQLLKLDTQGTELEILSSLDDERWRAVLAIEVEVEFAELYQGQPLFTDVDGLARARGLELFDLRTHRAYRHGPTGERHYLGTHLKTAVGTRHLSAQLVAGDALYLRPPDDPLLFSDPVTLARYILILLVYGYHDLALCLLDGEPAAEVLGAGEIDRLRAEIIACAPRPAPWQRTGVALALVRRAMARILPGRRGHAVFWTRREWPDQ